MSAYEPTDPKHPDRFDRLIDKIDADEHHLEPPC